MATKREENIAAIVSWLGGLCNLDTDTVEDRWGSLQVETDECCYSVSAMMTEGDDS